MATFFGEVLPVVSRAVDDEYEESTCKEPSVKFVCEVQDLTTLHADFLVFGIGPVASAFLNAYCLKVHDVKEIGYLKEESNSTAATERMKDDRTFSLYASSKNNFNFIYCLAPANFFDSEKVWCYVEKLFQLSFCDRIQEVIVLDSFSIHQYLSEERDETLPVVKSLWTCFYDKEKVFSSLKQPNTITGISAAVLTKCELKKIPAILHVCFTDSFSPSISAINAFAPILDQDTFDYDNKMKESVQDNVRSIVSSHGSEQSIYV